MTILRASLGSGNPPSDSTSISSVVRLILDLSNFISPGHFSRANAAVCLVLQNIFLPATAEFSLTQAGQSDIDSNLTGATGIPSSDCHLDALLVATNKVGL